MLIPTYCMQRNFCLNEECYVIYVLYEYIYIYIYIYKGIYIKVYIHVVINN